MSGLHVGVEQQPEESRRHRVLDAALGVFLRYGYRKTSMEEVARVAQLSRQGLYLHFPNKAELFRAALKHTLDTGLQAAEAQLQQPESSLEARLTGAIEVWAGRFVGLQGDSVSDLHEASVSVGGPLVTEYETAFIELVSKTLRPAGLVAAYKSAGVSARQLAELLNATVRGLKYRAPSRQEFMDRVGVAVRVLCTPLRDRQC